MQEEDTKPKGKQLTHTFCLLPWPLEGNSYRFGTKLQTLLALGSVVHAVSMPGTPLACLIPLLQVVFSQNQGAASATLTRRVVNLSHSQKARPLWMSSSPHRWTEVSSVNVSPLPIHTDTLSKRSLRKFPHSISSQGAQVEPGSCVQTSWLPSLHPLCSPRSSSGIVLTWGNYKMNK